MARDLNDTLMFVRVVEHGSFSAAARALRLPKANVSQKSPKVRAFVDFLVERLALDAA